MKHLGIYLPNTADKTELINAVLSNNFLRKHVDLSGLHGELFSIITINQLIDEEFRHDKFIITTENNSSLVSMSSGQQRRALLNYIISGNPGYILLDDVFSSVDMETQQFIIENLNKIASSVLLIQLFYRKTDVLRSIQEIITIDCNNKIITTESRDQFLKLHKTINHHHKIELPHLFSNTDRDIDPLIQLHSVSVAYGNKPVLNDINWTVKKGEFWQLKGPNGSGKSTLLSILIGDNPRGYGQDIILFGRKKGTGESIWDIKKRIGYFTPNMTLQFTHNDPVEHMIISGFMDSVGLYTKPTDLQRNIANAWIKVLGPSFEHKTFNQLSFGQQRILLVVRAMVKHPPLLILDEPTVGLDDENAELFINMVNAIAIPKKVAIIFVSHRTEPGLIPDKIFELKPTIKGSIGEIINHNTHEYNN